MTPQATDCVALVPMRHESERVVGKNYRPLLGKPLYRYIIETLMRCGSISRIVIDTDSEEIARDARDSFPDVEIVERPEHLRAGTIAMNEVLRSTISRVEGDLFLQTHSTNPLLRPETIDAAVSAYVANPRADSLFSVTRLQARLWDEHARAINHDPQVLVRTQDLDPLYVENSCFYVFSRDTLQRTGNRLGPNPQMMEIPLEEAWDIDEEGDLVIAECLLKRQGTV